MIVKDEENTIEGCLDGVIDLFDDVMIIDNGSTDKTLQILRKRYNIKPIVQEVSAQYPHIRSIRNLGFTLVETPWIFVLDADERVSPDALERFRRQEPEAENCGFFFRWDTYGNGAVVEDYKLAAFRRSIRSTGLAHETVQSDIRDRGKYALWFDDLAIGHYPESAKLPVKQESYIRHLLNGIEKEPDWSRYHWFLGYSYFRSGRMDEAWEYLEVAAAGSSKFPVESLNARMILTEMHARQGRRDMALEQIDTALEFHNTVKDDFEVKVNFRLKPWLEEAREFCIGNRLEDIHAYAFSH
jgi:glycosyltransferase involved in cell wall biosynthesis